MSASSPHPDGELELSPEMRDYLVACVRAARPSRSRDEALRLLAESPSATLSELPPAPAPRHGIQAPAGARGLGRARGRARAPRLHRGGRALRPRRPRLSRRVVLGLARRPLDSP